ncbi:prolyl oligopeptidase family serine peptidase [Lysobacter arenosi]|uniref:Prolyl oligopeptidase family serine peptidase n=1 Tax=Lysobacter arenosi TaxID=2795387 RepID=A0ABX7R8N2_9GAMM|nr:prolyl oligopeptidase family serine peptidase [Lysobacter arenosi]QSX74110.1 prolyl oligopeptidase family serine peptidase [Lysobacter arenosi]
MKLLAALLLSLLPLTTQAGNGDELIRDVGAIDRGAFAAANVADFEHGEFVAGDGTRMRYRLLAPLDPRPGQRYPLVLQLHSSGGIGSDNAAQIERLPLSWAMPDVRRRYRAYVLVPQFEQRSANYDSPTHPQSAVASPSLSTALDLVEDFASHHPVDRQRIYAVGFSMGGSATWLAAAARPKLFAAIVPVSGIAPADDSAAALLGMPAWVIHGNADTENPIDADRRFVAAIRAKGGDKVRLREYDGLDHRLPADIYPGDWWRDWLFSRRRR